MEVHILAEVAVGEVRLVGVLEGQVGQEEEEVQVVLEALEEASLEAVVQVVDGSFFGL